MALFPVERRKPGDAEKLAWLRLARTENVGPVGFYQLIETYGSAGAALEAIPALAARAGRRKPLFIPPAAAAEKEYDALRRLGGELVVAAEEAYPLPLGALPDAPPVLSVRGDMSLLKKPGIAVVGARSASLNGRRFAETLAQDLGRAGQVVISGLARGIDTAAHRGGLATGTIAVVAGGVDIVYPPENEGLYREIAERGLIVAESRLGQQPFAQSFPRRNRIVSGLSAGVVVIEATLKSGSLITARLAGEQGRDLYAVPGHPMDPRAAGPNHLIREGAILARNADDVLEHLQTFSGGRGLDDSAFSGYRHERTALTDNNARLESARAAILETLSFTPVSVDMLLRENGLSIPVLQTILLELELAGTVQRLPGNRVVLLRESP